MDLLYPLTIFSLDTATPQFSSTPVKLRPFTIQGGSTGIPPANPDRTVVLYTENKDTPRYSTTPSDYEQTQVNTRNIILTDYFPSSTLVDMVDSNSPRYEFAFAAFHKNDLATTSDKNKVDNVVSVVFRNNTDIYHIQIPIVVSSSMQAADVNPLLRCWMDPTSSPKESFSINQLLSFKQTQKVEFDRFTFTMKYNQTSTPSTNTPKYSGKYTLCLMKTPQFVLNYSSLVKNDLPSFNDVFNYMMYSQMNIKDPRFPLQLSPDVYLMANTVTKYPQPTFYIIQSGDLAKVRLATTEGFADTCSSGATGRLLNSVKCYPIDLVTQVDANGDIMIDENTSRPMDVTRVKAPPLLPPPNPTVQTNYTFIVLIILISVILLAIVAGLLYWCFRAPPAAPLGSAAAVGSPSQGSPSPSPGSPSPGNTGSPTPGNTGNPGSPSPSPGK